MRKLFFCIVVLFLAACTSTPVSVVRYGSVSLNLDSARASARDIFLSSLVSSVEYVPLETTDSSLFAAGSRICVTDKYIVVENPDDVPRVFDRKGKFLNKIGRRGRGPGEIPHASHNMYVDPETYNVALFQYNGVLRYDIQGNFLSFEARKELPTEGWATYEWGGTDRYSAVLALHPDSCRLFLDDRQADDVSMRPVPGDYAAIPVQAQDGSHRIAIYLKTVNYLSDHVGYYDPDHRLYYRFYYDGRVEIPYKIKYSGKTSFDVNVAFSPIFENDRYCFMRDDHYQFIYRKNTGELSCMKTGGAKALRNDIDSGLDIYPWGITPDGYLYMLCRANLFKELSAGAVDPDLRMLGERLRDDDNPVIVYAKLK